ncbi:glycosyltransferase [Streptomyces endophyticus]|uniref:Glycosyltransferase n=1 Tax=Streptomyces endophyticus TaxID=714166 RepID=A0ABU6FFW2_9ACTN|nr:glycosyltransferase [Streptomyces endophyticus]MEB8342358.1 glycosyltransferase [Streptomyces endophyticus]
MLAGSFLTAVLFVRCRAARPGRASASGPVVWGGVAAGGAVAGVASCAAGVALVWPLAMGALSISAYALLRRATPRLHTAGHLMAVTGPVVRLALVGWWAAIAVPLVLRAAWPVVAVAAVWVVLGLLRLPSALLDAHLTQEVLCRRSWRRPTRLSGAETVHGPRICVHVPCHAEPPDVVMATLDALATQRYQDFEVLVIDNNTADPALWRPVQDHCDRLGPRFRFLHVMGLTGAKAGALNLALEQTDSRVEVIAVVDADYQVRPDFLSRLAVPFADGRTGFVQARHDYRGWSASGWLTGCYYEYRLMYSTYLVARNAYDSALIAGTLCLVRHTALREVGGWAEWCGSEDSELALRITAAGWRSQYTDTAFGYGLIPETFVGYRRQRARWVSGPAQELRHYWRLFLPRPWAAPSRLDARQKMLHAHHGAREALRSLHMAASLPLALAAVAFARKESELQVDGAALGATLLFAVASLTQRWNVFRYVVGASRIAVLRAWAAQAALDHVCWTAGFAFWRGRRPWLRTSKFTNRPCGLGALAGALPELLMTLLWLAMALGALLSARSPLGLLIGCGLLLPAGRALAAPAAALYADRCLAHAARHPDTAEPRPRRRAGVPAAVSSDSPARQDNHAHARSSD